MAPLHRGPVLRRAVAPYIVWLLILASVVSWRRGVYFSGELDPVVIVKAVIGVAALAAAAGSFHRGRGRLQIGVRTLALLVLYLAIAFLGALADGNPAASVVLSIRVLLIAVTVVLLVATYPARTLFRSLLVAMALVGLCATASGLASVGVGGRIYGVFPPLNPNEISLLCGLPALGIVHQLTLGNMKNRIGLPLLMALLASVWMTGSRTGLFAFSVAVVLILLHARQLRVGAGFALIALIPAVFFIVAGTDLVTTILERGDDSGSDLLTLNARTIAWDTVLNTPSDTWQRWVGAGLSVKQVAVEGQYWQDQALDSSWISALAQAGVVGTLVLAVWSLTTVASSLAARDLRSLTTPVLAFILVRSFLENGLVDSNVPFVVFLTVSLLVERAATRSDYARQETEECHSRSPSTQMPHPRGFAQQARHSSR
ncbi:O-antigen ligase family protein [Arthrobacter sp. CG_A4]|uniref:O-antigen ligase family protein n=1 Tax=Arthrobacter sp. CG_A4 TaxID=3071706 RepID=UPI002E0884E7|nr:O-antigen ligase [Arthrobacter sp. CG_A4]